MGSIVEQIIIAICQALLLPLTEDAITGKLNTPHTATVAEADPVVQQQAADTIAAYDKVNP
jgi:hypothetical protein